MPWPSPPPVKHGQIEHVFKDLAQQTGLLLVVPQKLLQVPKVSYPIPEGGDFAVPQPIEQAFLVVSAVWYAS